ncbi:sugar-binding protein [Actinomadura graeca]|uniref:Sugar-binding protein n=1 Tax=Actinomadura graeca TaxID=2750812 RepID=A0ABX8R0L6_9ACTN|nr:DddA-like double-stranded DNA deaminase toxin [Actinomadura graeca]QXJ24408.1 sugar-binding protein [Actinomadura graeca]
MLFSSASNPSRRRLFLGMRRSLRHVSAGVSVVMAAGLATAPAAHADPPHSERPKVADHERTVGGKDLKVRPRTPDPATRSVARPNASWPKPGSTDVTVTGGRAKVAVLDRAAARRAGVDGLVFTLTPDGKAAAERVGVRVDYSAFAQAFGGSYGSRLRLVRLPVCALTTPAEPECQTSTPVATTNNGETRTLTADVATPTVLAAVAAPEGSQGDFKATKLEASATWAVTGNTGDFTWTYPMRVPPVPGDLVPAVELGYSAQSVDGRTGNTNNQPSWAGEGFEFSPGFIERRYKACEDDGVPNGPGGKPPGDLCWGYENAVVTWNGKGGELIKAADGTWRLKDDDGTRFERLTDTKTGNGDDDGEYWKVTTTDGTQYFFGRNHLPGSDSGGAATNSAWTVPVFGDDDGEPCHKASGFADSWCQQAWRWNLDMVLDSNDNAIAYHYQPETNHYGRNLNPADATPYTRGGHLTSAEYGLRGNNMVGAPAARVNFEVSERCIPTTAFDCAPAKISTNPGQWADVPWDMNCEAKTPCKDGHGSTSPTFWSRKRLTKVTTQINKGAGWPYRNVDSWTLDHRWGADTDERDLLAAGIQHTGLAGATTADDLALPKVTFNHVAKANRVDQAGDGVPPYTRYRVSKIFDESGGQIDIGYTGQECFRTAPPTPQSNTKRCFPSIWHPPGQTTPYTDWFNKYVVTSVAEKDRTGHAPDMATLYDYIGGAAWHYDDDDGLTREKFKTWSQWRGYGQIRIRTGSPDGPSTQADAYYLRGMHGDRAGPDGGTKTVTVPDGEGGTHTDAEGLEGFTLKTVNYTAPGGAVHDKTVNTAWRHQTATRTRSWGTVTANAVKVGNSRTWTAMDGGAWRETKIVSEFETDFTKVGRVKQVDDLGDVALPADDRCTRTGYADNVARWMVSYQSRAETVSVACATEPDRSKHVIADARAFYDGGGFGDAPTKGNVTQTERIAEHDGSRATYSTVAKTSFDTFGRTLTVTNAADQTTTTRYTNTNGLTSRTTVMSPPPSPGAAGLSATEDLDPAWGSPIAKTDNNNTDGAGRPLRTDLAYDALGRLQKVWLPNRSKTAGDIPNLEHAYRIADGQIAAVTTKTLADTGPQRVAITLYDGHLRPRQVQAPGPGGRLITDTFYDDRGQVAKTYAPYSAAGAPETALFGVDAPGNVETQSHFSYDGLGRQTVERLLTGNGTTQEKWRTTIGYGGNWITVDPPQGGTPTAQITDARGQVTERRQYRGDAPSGAYDATTYGYDPAGRLTTVKDPSGKTWANTFDLRGRRTRSTDPDTGTSTLTYDVLDQIESTTDARNKTIFHAYDALGRRTQTREGSAAGRLLASWTYDTAVRGKGKPATATRHGDNGDYVSAVPSYDVLGRPESTAMTIPVSEGPLAGTYTHAQTYNLDGTVREDVLPAAGGLPQETLAHAYDDYQRPTRLTSAQATYVGHTDYTPTGKPKLIELGTGGKRTWNTLTYQYGTQRLAGSSTSRENVAGYDRNAAYTYDDEGNILGISDVSNAGTDTQCFKYDHLRRMTDAWAVATPDCPQSPSTSAGPAPYRMHYTYKTDGSRAKEEFYNQAGTQISTRDYRYQGDPDVGGSVKGHMLGKVDQTGANPITGPETNDETYAYDAAGNPTTRTVGTTTQSLEWNSEGDLDKITQGDATVRFVYDADGNRLIRKDLTGATLYLPGTELRATNGSATAVGTRYYDHNGQTVAMRDASGVRYLTGDHQGTSQVAVNATDQKSITRRFTPFGQARGTIEEETWPDQKGFLGGTKDPTGLTHLGAREYDPNNGRFISADPVVDTGDPQLLNAYAYGGNNPVTSSDPDGLFPLPPCVRNPITCGHKTPTPKERVTNLPTQIVGLVEGAMQAALDDLYAAANYARNSAHDLKKSTAAFIGMGMNPAGPERPSAGDPPKQHKAPRFRIPRVPVDRDSPSYRAGRTVGYVVGVPLPGLPAAKLPRGIRWLSKILKLCRRSSFVPGTAVVMADGTRRPINEVKKGDKVLAADSTTGRAEVQTVQDTITSKGKKNLVQITVDGRFAHWLPKTGERRTAAAPAALPNAGSQGTVIATDEHPFWVAGDTGAWVRARDLEPGMWLRTSAGTYVQVTAVKARTSPDQRVHNLTVSNLSTYYVSAGETPVLVHNCTTLESVARGLGTRGRDAPTRGQVVNITDDGVTAIGQPVRSGGSAISGDIDDFLMGSSEIANPLTGPHPSITHVETKIAWFMRQRGIQSADVVINNADGPCTGVFSCSNAVEAILPNGSSMTVWFPDGSGGMSSVRLTGRAAR